MGAESRGRSAVGPSVRWPAADIQANDFGEHQVQNHERVVPARGHFQPRGPFLGSIEPVADVLQVDLDEIRDVGVVFNDENGLGHERQR